VSRNALVDTLFSAFVGSLPLELRGEAGGLACSLGLAPSADVPWSEVFGNAVTLGAPLFIADAAPQLGGAVVHDAVTAHLLAVIEAFGTDRIEDGQVARTPALDAILEHARRARDAAIARVAAEDARAYDAAGEATLAAIAEERGILRSGCAVDFARYLAVSLAKQRLGVPASLSLARSAGWDPRRRRIVARMLDAIWTALQLHDDVVDWEDDLARGGCWAAALAGGATNLARGEDGISTRSAVLGSGVLARMLAASARRYRAARRRAAALGVTRLAAWAREREATLGDLARHERESPGFAGRSRALSAWARSVLG
jgi:hypothetical protein